MGEERDRENRNMLDRALQRAGRQPHFGTPLRNPDPLYPSVRSVLPRPAYQDFLETPLEDIPQRTQDEIDRAESIDLFEAGEREYESERAGFGPMGRIVAPFSDWLEAPETRARIGEGVGRWLDGFTGGAGGGGAPNDDGSNTLGELGDAFGDSVRGVVRANNFGQAASSVLSGAARSAGAISDWWNEDDNQLSLPYRMGGARSLFSIQPGAEGGPLQGYIPDLAEGATVQPWGDSDWARRGLQFENARIEAFGNNPGQGPVAFDTSARDSYADDMTAAGINAGLNLGFGALDASEVLHAPRLLNAADDLGGEIAFYRSPDGFAETSIDPDGRIVHTYQGAYQSGEGSAGEAISSMRAAERALLDDIAQNQRPEYYWRPGPDEGGDPRLAQFYRSAFERRTPPGYSFSEGADGTMRLSRLPEAQDTVGFNPIEGGAAAPDVGNAGGGFVESNGAAPGLRRLADPNGKGFVDYTIGPDGGWRIRDALIADPADRGRGIGTALYEELIARARASGAPYIASDARVSPDAQRVWESLARRHPVERIDGEYSGTYSDPNYRLRLAPNAPARVDEASALPDLEPIEGGRSAGGGEVLNWLGHDRNMVESGPYADFARRNAPAGGDDPLSFEAPPEATNDLDQWVMGEFEDGAPSRAFVLDELVDRERSLTERMASRSRDFVRPRGIDELIEIGRDPIRAGQLPDEMGDFLGPYSVGGRQEQTPLLSQAIPIGVGAGGVGGALLFGDEANAEDDYLPDDFPSDIRIGGVDVPGSEKEIPAYEDPHSPLPSIGLGLGAAAAARLGLSRAPALLRETLPVGFGALTAGASEVAQGEDPRTAASLASLGALTFGAGEHAWRQAQDFPRQPDGFLPGEHVFRPDTIMRPEPGHEAFGRQVQEMVRTGGVELPPVVAGGAERATPPLEPIVTPAEALRLPAPDELEPLTFPTGFFSPETGEALFGEVARRAPPTRPRKTFDQLAPSGQARRVGAAADQIEAARTLGVGEFDKGATAMRAMRERAAADPEFRARLNQLYPAIAAILFGGAAAGEMMDGDPLGGVY